MIVGTEPVLSNLMMTLVKAKLEAATKETVIEPTFLKALCDGMAEAVIQHLVANVTVLPGQATLSTPSIPGVVTTPGKIS